MNEKNNILNIKIDPIENAIETIAMLNMAARSQKIDLEIDIPKLDDTLKSHVTAIQCGDLKHIEATLYSQAIILQDYFYRMMKMAAVSKNSTDIQLFGQLALKAQTQSRATLSALADIKHPKRTTFIKQQNNAINQQVNNNNLPKISQNLSDFKNELLTEATHETLDTRRTPETITINSGMETLEAINRCQNFNRERD